MRVRDALQRANDKVYTIQDPTPETIKTPLSRPTILPLPSPQSSITVSGTPYLRKPGPETSTVSIHRCRTHFPFALIHYDDDRGASAPIYSDSRLLPWTTNVELVAGAFRAATEIMASRGLDPHDGEARRSALRGLDGRMQQHVRPLDWNMIIRRSSLAGLLALVLHWGTVGSAVVYSVRYLLSSCIRYLYADR